MLKKGIKLDANSFLSQRLPGLCYIGLKRYGEAIATLTYLVGFSDRHWAAVNILIWAYCSKGELEEARKSMDEPEQKTDAGHLPGVYTGLSAAWLGDLGKAFHYLEQAYRDHATNILLLRYSPHVPGALRRDARYQKILDRVGFPN